MTAALLLACPICAQAPITRADSVLLLSFLAVPFVIAAIVLRAIRNVDT